MKLSEQQFRGIAWAISGLLCMPPLLVFSDGLGWNFSGLSSYRLFPLFGMLAFSLFLSHYIVAMLRRIYGYKKDEIYFQVTSLIALVLLLLHPAMLIVQLWLDGYGLPPGSYLENYIAPTLKWAAALGMISLIIFLLYELTRSTRFSKHKSKFQVFSDLAMIMIFVHGLALGSHLQSGWFRGVWLGYGLLLMVCLSYTYFRLLSSKLTKPKE